MAEQVAVGGEAEARRGGLRGGDIAVFAAMCVVAAAVGAGLFLQLRLESWLALANALALYVAMAALHMASRRSSEAAALQAEVKRLEAELARSRRGVARGDASSQAQGNARGNDVRATEPPAGVQQQRGNVPARGRMDQALAPSSAAKQTAPATEAPPRLNAAALEAAIAQQAQSQHAHGHQPHAHQPQPPQIPQPRTLTAEPSLPVSGAAPTTAPQAAAPNLHDVRPQAADALAPPQRRPRQAEPASSRAEPVLSQPSQPSQAKPIEAAAGQRTSPPTTARAASPAAPVAPAAAAMSAGALPSGVRDADVEVIQGLIKKLADEVNANDQAAASRRPPNELTESAIETSIEVLRTTAGSMRQPAQSAPASASVAAAPAFMPPPVPAQAYDAVEDDVLPARLAALQEAITSGRADVLLEPILGLVDQRPRHYQVHVRPKDFEGQSYADGPEIRDELRGTGLLPLLDVTRISRIAQIARRLADRGKDNAIFSGFSAESLIDDKFLQGFAATYHERESFSGQLVLTFAQSDVRTLSARERATLEDMRELGFRFALGDVTDLDVDFEGLRAAGFQFVKLDADVFLEGLPTSGGLIPASDICRYLAQLGLTLIVGGIVDEAQFARIYGFGVLFGQGQLFGGPRMVKAEPSAQGQTAAA